eukprot:TRINITY_DN25269_c0_g1_i1.p1 TRINITY_DN25269_c0_g1~~TRINITY_DN25269_c0_g1_i1.p1  ORF type:complete len:386 (+),score=59.21 TRINITY_DN25269_c0_g1_i1:93-1250(+)
MKNNIIPMAIAVFFMVIYVTMMLVHFEDALMAPPTERVARDMSVVRLPRIYLCPADRYRQAGVLWNSYDCKLTFKREVGNCPARLQLFGGEEPQEFRGRPSSGGNKTGECLEFGTHDVGVKEEWSAAWNEITLKASFVQRPPRTPGTDVLQEMELGYLPQEWEVGEKPSTIESYYAPLLRVPVYRPASGRSHTTGVATRVFLAEEQDRGRHEAGDYWYFYGATSLSVENASLPEQSFFHGSQGDWIEVKGGRRGVVHVVITLDDFVKYEYRLTSIVYTLLSLLGQLAGMAALFGWAFFRSPFAMRNKSSKQGDDAGVPASYQEDEEQAKASTHGVHHYRSVASTEEGEEEEHQSLLQVEERSQRSNRAPLLEAGLPLASAEGEGL